MSDKNREEGKTCYITGDKEVRDWFEGQWAIWPRRFDQTKTTNLSFHYGGILAYREIHGKDPKLARDLKKNVAWLDNHTDTD